MKILPLDKFATIDSPTQETSSTSSFLPKITKNSMISNVSPLNREISRTNRIELTLLKPRGRKVGQHKRLLKTLKANGRTNLDSTLKDNDMYAKLKQTDPTAVRLVFETTFNSLGKIYTEFQNKATEVKGDKEARKKLMLTLFFQFVCSLLDLPMRMREVQLRAMELVGDLLRDFSDCKNALFYYTQTVTTQ
eukprot:TRINITY_DN19345_c0_g2_i1.p1 TRINITY_DN19345_c0_g2~~TRINITY_DN19345_c0_g2_i1.p1  ORF type:complete len:192 (-),score=25.61 TRINITY_DN19345_c0_g2_i1:359-934(-)